MRPDTAAVRSPWIALLLLAFALPFAAIGPPVVGKTLLSEIQLGGNTWREEAVPGLPGDCDGDGVVSIGEVQRAINMFLGVQPPACGVDLDGNGTVSIGEVQKVINSFLGLLHVIQASASEGGTISPSGAVLVENGASKTFVSEAASGFALSDVLVDSVSVGPQPVYTFNLVLDSHQIQARFASQCEPPVVGSWTATPGSIPLNTTATLSATVSGTAPTWSISITGGAGAGTVNPSSGTGATVSAIFTGMAQGDVTLHLAASNACGNDAKDLTVTVLPPPPTIASWSASPVVVQQGEASQLAGVLSGSATGWSIQQVGGTGTGTVDPASGTGSSPSASFHSANGGSVVLQLTATGEGGSVASDLTLLVNSPGEDFQISATADSPGPYPADGVTGPTVSIQVQGLDGTPLAGLPVGATLMSGDDVKTAVPLVETRAGTYRAGPVVSGLSGDTRLAVWVEGAEEAKNLGLTFTPGPPHHFWIANTLDAVSGQGPPGVAYFELMLKDALDNVLDPALAQFTIQSDTPGVASTTTLDAAHHLVQVEVSAAGVSPGTNYWAQPVIHISEAVTGTSQDVTVRFPYLSIQQIPPTGGGNLGLRVVLLDPRPPAAAESSSREENFVNVQMMFPFPFTFVGSQDPSPSDDCRTNVTPSQNGISVSTACNTVHSGEVSLVDIFLDATVQAEGVFETALSGTVAYAQNFTTTLTSYISSFFVKSTKTQCIDVWLAPGVAKATAEAQVDDLKKRFEDATAKCCPNFSFTVTYHDISADDWKKVDKNGDNKLHEFNSSDATTDLPVSTDEEKELLKLGGSDCINVYYVPGMSDGSLGEAFAQNGDKNNKRDCNNVVVNGGHASGTTLAHEMGHCLGDLKDNKMPDNSDPPASNLMWQTKNDENRKGLTAEQCAEIKKLDP